MDKNIIYIAGPITGVPNYKETFKQYEDYLKAKGYTVLNPTAVLPEGLTNQQYMHACLNLIDCADAVLFLPGSDESKGALCEFNYCRYIDKPRAFSIHELKEVRA